MDEYQSIGQLTKPPLVYTAGFVAISLPAIQDHIGKLQDRLRDEYPGFETMEIGISQVNPLSGEKINSSVSQYVMNGPDKLWGVLVTRDRIIFHTISYSHFADFGQRFKAVLDIFKEVTSLKYHSGIAFRQIDNISPIENEIGLAGCINNRFLAPTILSGINNDFARQEYHYKVADGASVVQRLYAFENKMGPSVPADLLSLYVALDAHIMNKLITPPYMLADFEASRFLNGKSEMFDTDKMISELDVFHKYASLAFREVIANEALSRRK